MSQVILSGIRATGRLHFGNFLGAVQHFADWRASFGTCDVGKLERGDAAF